ncbi:MAG TPA: hypothetical protein DIU39_01235 [Flavobacteriales bacterium]|nr:hypothetical protein [Flavobacteriales bacterium]|tara:strand:- start:145043 stop:145828 length:786 start_codon:yes stop_codon:yes gene_type:complete
MRVKIVNPCSENYNRMTTNGKHKFCQKCAKNVFDLSGFTDGELYNFLKENPKVCGRLSAKQMNRDIVPQKNKTKASLLPLFSAAILLMGTNKVFSQAPVKYNLKTKLLTCPKTNEEPIKTDSTTTFSANKEIIISGKIQDEIGGPLPFATIVVENTTIGCFSDTAGNYKLIIPPDSIQNDTINILYSFIGFKKHVLTLIPKALQSNFIENNVTLNKGDEMFVGFLIVEEKPVKRFFRRIWFWLKRGKTCAFNLLKSRNVDY